MKLTDYVKRQALDHAKNDYPKESVGLVQVIKGKQRYFKCNNIATTPDEHFVLDPDSYQHQCECDQILSAKGSGQIADKKCQCRTDRLDVRERRGN